MARWVPDTETALALICVRLFKRIVGVTVLLAMVSPSACAFAVAAARSWVCHSCNVLLALALDAMLRNGVRVGVIR